MHARCSRRPRSSRSSRSSLSGCSYNRLVSLREAIDGAWAQVENQLQRRNDLIPNLIEVTKGYAAHEKEIFEAVANARAKMLAAGGSREATIAAAGEVSSARCHDSWRSRKTTPI